MSAHNKAMLRNSVCCHVLCGAQKAPSHSVRKLRRYVAGEVVHFELEPEVSGEWGENTVVNTSIHPPVVHELHYVFTGWLGDDLIESFPCYIISERLARYLSHTQLTGFKLSTVEVTKSDEFQTSYQDSAFPSFTWLQITGDISSDFYISSSGILVVTKAGLDALKMFNLSHCDISIVAT